MPKQTKKEELYNELVETLAKFSLEDLNVIAAVVDRLNVGTIDEDDDENENDFEDADKKKKGKVQLKAKKVEESEDDDEEDDDEEDEVEEEIEEDVEDDEEDDDEEDDEEDEEDEDVDEVEYDEDDDEEDEDFDVPSTKKSPKKNEKKKPAPKPKKVKFDADDFDTWTLDNLKQVEKVLKDYYEFNLNKALGKEKDEKRLKLAIKLAKEMDKYIDSLNKKSLNALTKEMNKAKLKITGRTEKTKTENCVDQLYTKHVKDLGYK